VTQLSGMLHMFMTNSSVVWSVVWNVSRR